MGGLSAVCAVDTSALELGTVGSTTAVSVAGWFATHARSKLSPLPCDSAVPLLAIVLSRFPPVRRACSLSESPADLRMRLYGVLYRRGSLIVTQRPFEMPKHMLFDPKKPSRACSNCMEKATSAGLT